MANKGVSVRGINTAKIPKMEEALDEWIKAINAAKITNSSKNITKALKGTTQEGELKKLCQAVESYTNNLTNLLSAYKNRLSEVKAAYEKNDTSSTSLSDVTAAINNLKS